MIGYRPGVSWNGWMSRWSRRKSSCERKASTPICMASCPSPEEFAAGHVPGAINIPIHELEKRIKELPRRREVVAALDGRPTAARAVDPCQYGMGLGVLPAISPIPAGNGRNGLRRVRSGQGRSLRAAVSMAAE